MEDEKTAVPESMEIEQTAQSVESPVTIIEPKFNKQQLVNSKKYQERRDLLNVLLKDESYTFAEVDAEIEKFMKKEFNKKEAAN